MVLTTEIVTVPNSVVAPIFWFVLLGLPGAAAPGGFAWRTLWHEARRTPSPHSGWPMAAMAPGLGVCLRKLGVYALDPPGRRPQPADPRRAINFL